MNNLDYLIVNTGYTSRLIKRLGFDQEICLQENALKSTYKKKGHNNIYKVGYSFDYKTKDGISKIMASKFSKELDNAFHFNDDGDDAIENFVRFIDSCVYIYDDLWGQGLYKISDDSNEINKIMSILDAKKIYKCGTICFKCKSRKDIQFFTKIYKRIGSLLYV
jgi:hypothetical protein